MDNAAQTKAHHTIVLTLKELGVSNAEFSITDTRILVRDGRYAGRTFVCGNVQVLMHADGQRIEFYDQDGGVLRVVCLSEPEELRVEAA